MNEFEIEKKFIEIRKDLEPGSYLNPFRAKDHIVFLLCVCEKLAAALRGVEGARREVM